MTCEKWVRMKRLTIQDCYNFANSKNGKCLSSTYKNAHTKLLWQCSFGHQWKAGFGHIKQGTWCPICGKSKQLTINHCRQIALQKDGECLSSEYKNARTKLKWRCSVGHEWESSLNSVKYHNAWCSVCSNNKKLSIDFCIKFAQSLGGHCSSSKYYNARTKLSWRCAQSHQWEATLDSVSRGSWCPFCVSIISKPQYEIYNYLNSVYENELILNDSQVIKPLDLDIYFSKLKIGIEYDGEFWHYSSWAIKNGAKNRMKRKKQMCITKNIDLLRIRENEWLQSRELEFQKIIDFIENKSCRNQ